MEPHVIKKSSFATAVCSTLMLSLGLTTANAQESLFMGDAENGNLWFVELSGAPTADGSSLASVNAQQAEFRSAAAAAGISYSERRTFKSLFNGFALAVTSDNRKKLTQLAGVRAIYPVYTIAAPTPEEAAGAAIDLVSAITLTGAKQAQDARGLSGNGIKVGIIDTGIDIDHPAFGGSGTNGTTAFPTARVAYGYDLVGNAYDAGGAGAALVPVPDPNPDDCNGHGTHVAGIVGANGAGLKGVAPGVTLGAYRVFGCGGSSSSDVIVEAMERAYADGMQVVNQSLGAARQWPQYPTAQAATRLVNRGVVMVASIGNNGPGGSSPDALFAAGAPGVGTKVIGVASFDNAQRAFTVNGTPYGYNPASAAPLPPTSGSLEMARTGTPASAADSCAPLPAGSLTGRAALIRRGGCSFNAKSFNAMTAGAAAVVLYNNAAGALNATVAGPPNITIPVVGITAAQGTTLDGLIAAGTTALTWTGDFVSFPFGTGGLISSFSSFGLAADLSLKPNIGAPGGGIFSSYPLELGGAATLSGTSMSSPHVAGGVALLLEAKPSLRPAAILARLQNSADPTKWSLSPGLGFLDHTFRQGAGMMDVIGALDATTTIEPGQISVGESQAEPQWFKVRIRNNSKRDIKYTISHEPALATGPNSMTGAAYSITGFFDAPATVVFDRTELGVSAGTYWDFELSVAANPALPDRSLYGGYIVVTPDDGGPVYRIPYAGFKGDYQSTVVLTPTANGFPWLAQLVGASFFNRPAGATYTMVGNDIPFFLLHLDHLSRRVRFEAFDAVTGKAWHRISDDEYVGRNSTPGGFFAFSWDGTTFKGNAASPSEILTVPDGQYVVKLSVLKALGDASNPAHWEIWNSSVVTIDRP
jgi:minor extracellular serine protease Vpr